MRLIVEGLCKSEGKMDEKQTFELLLVESLLIGQPMLSQVELTQFHKHISHYYNQLLGIQQISSITQGKGSTLN